MLFGNKSRAMDPYVRNFPNSDLKKLLENYASNKKRWELDSSTMKKVKAFYEETTSVKMGGYMMQSEFVQFMSIVSPPKNSVAKNKQLIEKFAQELFVDDKYKQCKLLTIDNVLAEKGEKTPAALKTIADKFGMTWQAMRIYFSNHAVFKPNFKDEKDSKSKDETGELSKPKFRDEKFEKAVRLVEDDIHYMIDRPEHAEKLAHGLNIFDALFENREEVTRLRSLLHANPIYAVELAYAIKQLDTKGIDHETIIMCLSLSPKEALKVAAKDRKGLAELMTVRIHSDAKEYVSYLRAPR